jgi:Flp pilus assembly protein TadG
MRICYDAPGPEQPGILDIVAMLSIKRLAAGVKRLAARGKLRRLIERRDGTAAVEFALVAAPFLALVFAIMETALVFFAGQALETAVAQSARLVMTGQAQNGGFQASDFQQRVCSYVTGLFNCANIQVNVQKFSSFSSVTMLNPLNQNGTFNSSSLNYNPGGPGDIVVVQLFYQWPVYVSLLGLNLSNMAGGNRLLVATAAFRNEPYQ